jgi:peptide/nickel transport system substrate-binding protein
MGWKMKGKFRVKDGKTLTLREVIPADTSSQTDVSQVVQASLADIGVQVKIQTVPLNDFFTKYINVGDYDLAYQGWTSDAFSECSGKSLYYPAESPQNKTFASSAQIGQLFDKACGTLDATARDKIGNQLDKAIWDVASQVTLFTDPDVAVVKDNLANYDGITSAYETPKWQDVGWLKQ